MDKQDSKKIITLSFLAAAALTFVVVNVLFKAFADAFGVVQKLYSNAVASHGLPIVLAVVVFAVLQFNPKIITWAEDVIMEVSKVVWPSRKDTIAMTLVVCVFVLVSSVLLIGIDLVARQLVQFIIH